MAWKKYLILTISSLWFFPVSCTTSVLLVAQVSSYLGPNHHDRGDPVPWFFSVAVFDQPASGFRLEKLATAASFPNQILKPTAQTASHIVTVNETRRTHQYQVIDPEKHIIEVISLDDDYTFTSIYQLKSNQIIPIYSRVYGIGNGMIGGMLGVPIAILIYEIGRYFRRRFNLNNKGITT
jgi:hypothetical protein